MKNLKELAKFLAGVVTWDCLIHIYLAQSRLLPLKIWEFTLTPMGNMVGIVVGAALAAWLIYYAWYKK